MRQYNDTKKLKERKSIYGGNLLKFCSLSRSLCLKPVSRTSSGDENFLSGVHLVKREYNVLSKVIDGNPTISKERAGIPAHQHVRSVTVSSGSLPDYLQCTKNKGNLYGNHTINTCISKRQFCENVDFQQFCENVNLQQFCENVNLQQFCENVNLQ